MEIRALRQLLLELRLWDESCVDKAGRPHIDIPGTGYGGPPNEGSATTCALHPPDSRDRRMGSSGTG